MNRGNAVTLTVSLLVCLLLLEFGLRTVTPYPLKEITPRVGHEWLAYVMNPELDEIDAAGFRNPEMKSVDLVAIGDSHTYGFNVTAEYSWPRVLGSMLGKNAYNFGVGGYGLLQYMHLVDRALEFKPGEIIVGLYLANDLFNVCQFVAILPEWATRLDGAGHDVSACPVPETVESETREKNKETSLKNRSALVSMLSELNERRKDWMEARFPGEDEEPGAFITVGSGHARGKISLRRIRSHGDYMDLSKPEIDMAFGVLERFLRETAQKTARRGIGFSVLLVPSRERVYYRFLTENGYRLPPEYERVVQNEDVLRRKTARLLHAQGIRYADILSAMEQALVDDDDLYPAADDGHPLRRGYALYADSVAGMLSAGNGAAQQ